MKKIVMIAVALMLATGLVFAGGKADSGKAKIGVSMPT